MRFKVDNFSPILMRPLTWFDAADSLSVTIETGVAQVDDKSGNGNHLVQSVATNQPTLNTGINNLNTLRFHNVNTHIMTAPDPFGGVLNDLTAFYVTLENISSLNFFISLNGNNTGSIKRISFHAPFEIGGIFYWDSPVDPDRCKIDKSTDRYRPYLATTLRDSSAGYNTLRLDGGADIDKSSGYTSDKDSSGGIRIGTNTNDHDLGEMILFNSRLPDYKIEIIEGYLAWKWGLVSNLPSTHPYKNRRP